MKIWFDVPVRAPMGEPEEKIVLVGQAPSRDTQGLAPFSGKSGRRIAELMGIEHDDLSKRFALANILDTWPGKQGKGDAFPLVLARKRGMEARRTLQHRTVIAFGASVVRVLGYVPDDHLLVFRSCGSGTWGALAYVPHPSGVNRWWNDPGNAAKAQAFLRKLVR